MLLKFSLLFFLAFFTDPSFSWIQITAADITAIIVFHLPNPPFRLIMKADYFIIYLKPWQLPLPGFFSVFGFFISPPILSFTIPLIYSILATYVLRALPLHRGGLFFTPEEMITNLAYILQPFKAQRSLAKILYIIWYRCFPVHGPPDRLPALFCGRQVKTPTGAELPRCKNHILHALPADPAAVVHNIDHCNLTLYRFPLCFRHGQTGKKFLLLRRPPFRRRRLHRLCVHRYDLRHRHVLQPGKFKHRSVCILDHQILRGIILRRRIGETYAVNLQPYLQMQPDDHNSD
nr:MAG TPA: hypothetical protein [Caudoviricetes sp.]